VQQMSGKKRAINNTLLTFHEGIHWMGGSMDSEIVAIYVICDEALKAVDIQDDPQAKMSTAEVVAFAIIAARLFGGNHFRARWLCKHAGYFPDILSPSRLNRRLHRVPWPVWLYLFRLLAAIFKKRAATREFAVDSFPLTCCKKSRIDRRKLFLRKEFIGFSASEKRYFCGIRVHMIVTTLGEPVEIVVRPASHSDLAVLWNMELDLPKGSVLYADGAYMCFDLEDLLAQDSGIRLLAKYKKSNRKRVRTEDQERRISSRRQIVETVFSCITGMLPRYIRARTQRGFLLRVMSAVLAYSVSCFLR
jgi:hypothetical protein